MTKKRIRRILIPGYMQFFLCILFWIGAGAGVFSVTHPGLYMLMAMLMLCSLMIILAAYMLDKFYLDNVRENFENLEKLNLKLRSERHEYLNEMQVVYGLLELGEYTEAADYLKPIYTEIARVSKALKTAKPAVNALLQSKMETAKERGIELFVEVSSNLSGIKMEQWDLCRILANLMDNAMTAVETNTGEKQVHIQISETKAVWLFNVYNNGPVIPKDKQELIFKKGYSSKKEAGHGLGLGIVQEIVTAAKGEIHVSSREGKTAFEVVIPKNVFSDS